MKFEDIPLRVPEMNSIERKMTFFTKELEEASDAQKAIATVKKCFKYDDNLSSDITVISIRNSINTRDEVYEKAMDVVNEVSPLISALSDKFSKAMINSKFRKELEDEFGSYLFEIIENSIKCFDDKIIPELQEENKLVTSYDKIMASAQITYKDQTLNLTQLGKYFSDVDPDVRKEAAKLYYGFIEEHDKDLEDIYSNLVRVRNSMAIKLGFKNYVELGYLRLGRVDYDKKMVKSYRKEIAEYVVPHVEKLIKNDKKRLGIKNPIFTDLFITYKEGNPKPIGDIKFLEESARKMYHEMSKETGTFYDFMIDNHLMDLEAKSGKMGGGYMTYISRYKSPFIFSNSNGTSADVDTLTHEFGHSFQAYLARNISVPAYMMPTLEACEIDSMSMEFFAYPWMDLFFGEKADKYRYMHTQDAIKFLPYGAEVDEFQEIVYENPNFTNDERNEVWEKLEKKYRPRISYKGFPYLEKGTYWLRQQHIFSTAFYYIDYTLAQVLALQFKYEYEKNKEKAWKKYIKLLKMGGQYPFVTLIKKAKLRNPFDEGNIKKAVKPQLKLLKDVDDKKL